MRKRVTAADIAREIGVSRATVGFVLNNTPGQTISEATRQRVVDAAARLGYRPHGAARALASGRSKLVLLVLPDWPIEFSMRLYLEEAYRVLEDAGYTLVTYTRHADHGGRPLWESLNPDVVIGFGAFSAADVESLRGSGVGAIFPSPDTADDPGDIGTFAEGPRLQVRHLAERGHRRLGFAVAPDSRVAALADERVRVARDAAAELGLPPLVLKTVDHRDGSALRAVEEWRAAGVTGIAAYNDDVAAEVVGAALRSGASVPGDLAVIGHDDAPIASVFVPALSSIRVDHAAAGRLVAQLALHQADGRPLPAALESLDAAVVARESTTG